MHTQGSRAAVQGHQEPAELHEKCPVAAGQDQFYIRRLVGARTSKRLVGAVLCVPAGFPAILLRVLLAFHAACLPTEILVFGAVASII